MSTLYAVEKGIKFIDIFKVLCQKLSHSGFSVIESLFCSRLNDRSTFVELKSTLICVNIYGLCKEK